MSDWNWKEVLSEDKEIKTRPQEFVEQIGENRRNASRILRKLGVERLPGSIIGVDHSKRSMDIAIKGQMRDDYLNNCLTEFTKQKKINTLSRFPYNVGELFVRLYTNEDEIVLDPFAGHNSRMELCYKLNRHYVGWDISEKFMECNEKILKILNSQQKICGTEIYVDLITGDSKDMDYKDMFDFCMTSPPYWDTEQYGDEPGQLPLCESYEAFLKDYYVIIQNCYRALKKNKFICWVVGDFRRKGNFVMFHSDTARLFKKAGFKLWDIVIMNNHETFTRNFPNRFYKVKIFPKTHEYAVVGKKE